MTVADIYHEFPELMTPEEKEEDDSEEHDENGNCLVEVTSIPRWFNEHTTYLARPEAPSRAEFERRKPALGLSRKQIQQLRDHYNDPRLLPVQKRMFLDYLREKMLRQCISTDGCTTVEELLTILEAEIDSNTPAPVPDWYEYTKITHGPRDTGFYLCENRGCFRTESCDKKPFDKCGNCKLARYCSRECQVADWKARHKKICKKAKELHDMVEKHAKLMTGRSRTKSFCSSEE